MPREKCVHCYGMGIVNVSRREDDPDWILCGKCDTFADDAVAELESINGQIEAGMSIQRAEELNRKLGSVIASLSSVDFTRRASDLVPIRMKSLKFLELPKKVQDAVDGMEFITGFECDEIDGKIVYRILQGDSFEVWSKLYDSNGKKISESAFFPRESESEPFVYSSEYERGVWSESD